MLHFWAVIIKTICPYTNYVKNKTKMFIFNLFSSAFLIFNFLRFLPCILLQRLFYYGSEAIEWFILLNYCVNPFDFSLETYLDSILTKKNRTKLSFIQCTVRCNPDYHDIRCPGNDNSGQLVGSILAHSKSLPWLLDVTYSYSAVSANLETVQKWWLLSTSRSIIVDWMVDVARMAPRPNQVMTGNGRSNWGW